MADKPQYDAAKAAELKSDIEMLNKLGDPRAAEKQAELDQMRSEFKSSTKSFLSQAMGNIGTPSQMAAQTPEMHAANQEGLANAQILSAEQDQAERAAIEARQGGKAALSMADQIGSGEAFRRGLTIGSREVTSGLGLDKFNEQPTDTPMQETYTQALKQTNPIKFGAGKILAESAPFIPISWATGGAPTAARYAGAAAGIPSLLARAATTAVIGGAQSNIISRGAGDSGTEQVGNTIIGTAIGAASELLPIGVGAAARYLSAKVGLPVNRVVTPAGDFTQEVTEWAGRNNIDLQQVAREAQNDPNITASLLRESAPTTPQQAAGKLPTDYTEIASVLNANKEIVDTFERVGINVEDLPLGAFSDNKSIAGLGSAMAALGGNQERQKLLDLSEQVNRIARENIERAAGDMSAGNFSETTLNAMRATEETLKAAEDIARGPVNRKMAEFTMNNLNVGLGDRAFVKELKAAKALLRGKNLSDAEESVLDLLTSRPTYQQVDKLRKEIGGSLGKEKGKGLYPDQDQGILKRMYEKLSDIQHATADRVLGSGELAALNNATKKRKALEKQIEFFSTKTGLGSMVGDTKSVGTQLTNGDYANFDEVFSNLPKEYHQAAAATMIGQMLNIKESILTPLGIGARAGNFNTAWTKVESTPLLKGRLQKALGDDNFKAMSEMSKMYGAISRAASTPATGAAKGAIEMAEKEGGIYAKLLGSFARRAVGNPTLVDVAGSLVAVPKESGLVENIARMLNSGTFKQALGEAMNDPASAAAVAKSAQFMKTRTAQDFMKSASQDTRKQIFAAGGIPAWLMLTDDKNKPAEAKQ